MPHNRSTKWKLLGHYVYDNIVGYEQYYCLLHRDNNIISIDKNEKDVISKSIMQKLCKNVTCKKNEGDIKTLPLLTLYF